MKAFFAENKRNVWFWLFVATAVILLFAMPLMSRSAGNSGDEDKFQIPQGRFVLDYFASDGADTTCLQDLVQFDGRNQMGSGSLPASIPAARRVLSAQW